MLTICYTHKNKNGKMIETFDKALVGTRKEPALWELYAFCLNKSGEKEKAIRTLEKGLKKIKDLTAADVRAGFDRQRMLDSVANGMKNDAGKVLMKPYSEKLSADEIAALVDYVFALPH